MSLPRGCIKSDSGAIFITRTQRELATWSDDDLRARWRWLTGQLDPETGGLAYMRSDVRRVALRERTAIVAQMHRRSITLRS